MKLITALVTFLLAAFAVVVNAQVTYNNVTGAFSCFPGGGAYCAGDSMMTNIIIRCIDKVGQPGNCNDNLAGAPPVGVKTFAPCYESSLTAGDAACSWNCTAYPDTGNTFTLPSSVTSQCFVPGAAPPNPNTGSSSPVSNGTATSSSSVPAEIFPMTSVASGYGVSPAPTAFPTTTSATINLPAAVSAMTAGGVPMYSSFASGSSDTTFPSSLSALGPLFSSLIANAGNATVSAISTQAGVASANANGSMSATAAPTATGAETVSTITSTSGSSTITITTTLSSTYTIPSPTGEGTGPVANGTHTSAVASPSFTGGATSNINVKASYMVALMAIPAMLLY